MSIKVLFVCVHNSARSQIAEAYLKKFGANNFEAESAGLDPGKLNPVVVEVMKEDGMDISNNRTKGVFDFFKEGRFFNYVISVCDEANAKRCPIFPGSHSRISWSFSDPSTFTGTTEEKLKQTRIVRDKIKAAVRDFINVVQDN